MTELNALLKHTAVNAIRNSMNQSQLTVLHQVFKTLLLTQGFIKVDLPIKDQLYLGIEKGNWATIGEIVVISFSYGEYSPSYAIDGEDAWLASGSCYFPVNEIDEAVMYLLVGVTENGGPYTFPSSDITPRNLEYCRDLYDTNPEIKAKSLALYDNVGPRNTKPLMDEVKHLSSRVTNADERNHPVSIQMAKLRNDLQRVINEIDCVLPPGLQDEVDNRI